MTKNLQIEILYHEADADIQSFIEMNTTNTIRNLKEDIKSRIDDLKKVDFVILNNELNNSNILDDDLQLSQIATSGIIKLKILPTIVDVTIVSESDDPKNLQIDITEPLQEAINKLVTNDYPSRYVFAYEILENEYRVCCSTLPLSSHDWWYNRLRLIRRIYKEDKEHVKNELNRKFLIENAHSAIARGLSAYSLKKWAKIAALKLLLITEDPSKTFDLYYVKENIAKLVSPAVLKENSLYQPILNKFNKLKHEDLEDIETLYLQESSESGCQCAYIEAIKFKIGKNIGSKFGIWHNRYIFVSPTNIEIFKGYGVTEKYSCVFKEINDIRSEEPSTIILILKNGDSWMINSKSQSKIRRLHIMLTSISIIVKDDMITEKTEKDNKSEEILGEQIGEMIPNIKNLQSYGIDEKKEIKKTKDLIIDYIEPPPKTIRTESSSEESKKIRYSEIIPPKNDDSEDDENGLCFLSEHIKVLEIHEELEDNSNKSLTDEELEEIERDKFFETGTDVDWRKNSFTIIAFFFILFQIILIYYSLKKKYT
ncbi:hypothetical protein TRFO_16727 [Tritrichomonas foetus]|uniref:Ubiquitin-like domain-containing protein n=1 Tax=Tritrichomonas foetus TaxID=1144522 RepID=A0A1J4KPE9_9EUKA|nr:hypothetical protein TRFO_16727 [Tritrichomonas foetus]|eukprot:OHT13177.1 hypothetical protein TRFO_16727 [Tritrichomonas foetus]